MKKEKRNGIISLWKFLFAIVIVFYHGARFYGENRNPFFVGGYIAVEFFFIISGFYLAKKAINDDDKSLLKGTYSYLFKTIKKLAPYIIISFVFSLLIEFKFGNIKKMEVVNSIYSLFLLRQFGFKSPGFFGSTWYISVMLFSIFLLYPLFHKYKEKFVKYFSIIIVILGIGYMSQNYGNLDLYTNNWNGIFFSGTIRGIVEMNIGAIIFVASNYIKNIEFTKIGRIILTIIGEFLIIFTLVIINYSSKPYNYDFTMIFFISIAILIFVTEKGYDYKILSNNVFYYLEKLSMPIYLNHYAIIKIVDLVKPFSEMRFVNQSITAVLMTILISMIEIIIIESNFCQKISSKIFGIIINNKRLVSNSSE